MKARAEIMTGWKWAKRAALRTIGKKPKTEEPTAEWKLSALIAEYSPIKLVEYWIDVDSLMQYVGVHILRHPYVLPFICSQRSDRSTEEQKEYVLSILRDDIRKAAEEEGDWRKYRMQGSENDHTFVVNAQTLINISRKRLCCQASKETQYLWRTVKSVISDIDPEMSKAMVRQCLYRGWCPEISCCGYVTTNKFKNELEEYHSTIPPVKDRIELWKKTKHL